MERRKIRELIGFIEIDYHKFSEIRELMNDIVKNNPDYFDFYVDKCEYAYDVFAYRYETDKELATRKKKSEAAKLAAKKRRANKEKKERETY